MRGTPGRCAGWEAEEMWAHWKERCRRDEPAGGSGEWIHYGCAAGPGPADFSPWVPGPDGSSRFYAGIGGLDGASCRIVSKPWLSGIDRIASMRSRSRAMLQDRSCGLAVVRISEVADASP